MLENTKEVSELMEQFSSVANQYLTFNRKLRLETIRVVLKENQDDPEIDNICKSILTSNTIIVEAYQLTKKFLWNIKEIDELINSDEPIGPLELAKLWSLREECTSSIADAMIFAFNKYIDNIYDALLANRKITYFVSLN